MRNLVIASLLLLTVPVSAMEHEQVWEQIRTVGLDTEHAVEVERLEVKMGMGVLHIETGVLIPAAPVEGRRAEMVFVGEGSFTIEPPDPVEEKQIEIFTGQATLDTPIKGAVLVTGDREVSARLLDGRTAATLDEETTQKAVSVFSEWVESAERRGFGADAAILGSIIGDADARGFFVAWMRTEDLGDCWYRFDPSEYEQITLGQFVEIEADDRRERQIRRSIRKGKRKGRYGQLRFEDLGDWDTWVSTSMRDADGQSVPGYKGFEAEHYVLDATVLPADETVTGTARIRIRAEKNGKRILPMSLYPDLAINGVRDGEGTPLTWFQTRGDVYVVLPTPTRRDHQLEIVVDFSGKVLDELEKGTTYSLMDTYSWYPRVGDYDRATYDVTLRRPKRKDLLASGRVVESGEESGMRWERRTLDVPSAAFSFEVGEFDIRTEQVGHVELTVGFSKIDWGTDKGAKEEVMQTLREALPFYEEAFGKYPLDHLTVATIPRGYSQGFLGFLTLTHFLVARPGGGGYVVVDTSMETRGEARAEQRRETLSHELSHQWWGNKVGWRSYRDQWLSEALAMYSASLFTASQAKSESVYRTRRAKEWRSSLKGRTEDGRSVESLGPVVLGGRLSSSLSSRAYTAVVYDKGSVVFTMLARLTGDDNLKIMLKHLADRVDNGVIDTPTFIMAIERMSGLSLETFAAQFVYGTGVPEVYYRYEFVPQDDGTWVIQGKAWQVTAGHSSYRLVRKPSGGWFVTRETTQEEEEEPRTSAFVVPFQIALASAKDAAKVGHALGVTTTEKGLGGKVLIRGETSEFSIQVPREPREFWLDQRGEVLAEFYCEQRRPKRMLRYKAYELARARKYDEAEELYRRALAAPLVPEGERDEGFSERDYERDSRMQNCLIHLGLCRLYVETERLTEAREELVAAESLLRGRDKNRYRGIRIKLESALEVCAGDYTSAYDRLSKLLRLDFPMRDGESLADMMRRKKFRSSGRWWGDGRDYALLAVSAFESGHPEVAAEAIEEAEERGADLRALRELTETR